MKVYRIHIEERRPLPEKDYPHRTADFTLLDMEVALESFDFGKLLAMVLDMLPDRSNEEA